MPPVIHCRCPGLPLVKADGYCDRCRPAEPTRTGWTYSGPRVPLTDVVDDLPHWCSGVTYRGDTQTIVLQLVLPLGPAGAKVAVNLETHVGNAAALATVLTRCVDHSRRSVVDVLPE